MNQPHQIVPNIDAVVESVSALAEALWGFVKAAIASVNVCGPKARNPNVRGTKLNQSHPIAPKIDVVSEASSVLTVGVVDFLEATFAAAKAGGTDVTALAWENELFSLLWNHRESSAFTVNKQPDEMGAYCQLIQRVDASIK